jgi:hypothetical protein
MAHDLHLEFAVRKPDRNWVYVLMLFVIFLTACNQGNTGIKHQIVDASISESLHKMNMIFKFKR